MSGKRCALSQDLDYFLQSTDSDTELEEYVNQDEFIPDSWYSDETDRHLVEAVENFEQHYTGQELANQVEQTEAEMDKIVNHGYNTLHDVRQIGAGLVSQTREPVPYQQSTSSDTRPEFQPSINTQESGKYKRLFIIYRKHKLLENKYLVHFNNSFYEKFSASKPL